MWADYNPGPLSLRPRWFNISARIRRVLEEQLLNISVNISILLACEQAPQRKRAKSESERKKNWRAKRAKRAKRGHALLASLAYSRSLRLQFQL